jgi:putative sterol carrier protein
MIADILPYLERLRARCADPDVRKAFQGFSRTLQFTFPDLQRTFLLTIAGDGTAALTEGTLSQPDVQVTLSSDALAGILDRKINPISAYITRRIRVIGKMDDLLKLQNLL